MSKAVIIGAGIAGIATAIRLAVKGWEVEVFEANAYPGGKLTEFEQDGFRFDAGPSLFTMPYLVEDLFRLAGKSPEDHFHYAKLELACKYFWKDGSQLDAWSDPQRFAEEVEQVMGVKAASVKDHLDDAAAKYQLTKSIFLEKSLHKAGTYFQPAVLKAVAHAGKLQLLQTMHSANSKRFDDPKLVQLFDRFATYNGSNPYAAPGIMNLIPHLEHGIGAAFPKGGMVAITHSLVALAEELGVQFRLATKVDKILVQNGRAVGLRAGGKEHRADAVVSNMDVVPTYRHLLMGQKAPEKVLAHPRSSSALIFYWGMQKQFPQLDLHNIFFSEDYHAEFKAIFEDKGLHPDPTVYVHISSKYEPSDAPEGMENWFVMINVPGNTGQDWDALIDLSRERILTKLEAMLGTDLRRHIACERILDPRSIEQRTSSYQGSLYGASSNNRMSAFLRHANFSSRIKGLYFCGGSVHPGGGIPLCLLSAKITTEMMPAI